MSDKIIRHSEGVQSYEDNLNSMTPIERRLIESNLKIIEDPEVREIVFSHSVFCQTSLPYRNPGDDRRHWDVRQGKVALTIEAGRLIPQKAELRMDVEGIAFKRAMNEYASFTVPIGLPFGAGARLIMIALCTQAVQSQSRKIFVEDSMTAFVKSLGIPTTGRYINNIKDQMRRLGASHMTLTFFGETETAHRHVSIKSDMIEAMDLWFPKNEDQHVMWPTYIELNNRFFESLAAHAVPLNHNAVSALTHTCMGLDTYSWLAQRLHRVEKAKGQFVPWTRLFEQFGQGYKQIRQFRAAFRKNLRQVLAVYPEAAHAIREEEGRGATTAAGLRLFNAPPPVRRTTVTRYKPAQEMDEGRHSARVLKAFDSPRGMNRIITGDEGTDAG